MAKNVLAWIFPTFVETIHVELSDKRIDVSVSKVFWEDMILKLIDLFDGKFTAIGHPVDDGLVLFVF